MERCRGKADFSFFLGYVMSVGTKLENSLSRLIAGHVWRQQKNVLKYAESQEIHQLYISEKHTWTHHPANQLMKQENVLLIGICDMKGLTVTIWTLKAK